MTNLSLDYGEIQRVSTQLKTAFDQTVSQLESLRGQVTQLLNSPALHMEQTSPALTDGYQQFNTMLSKNIEGLNGFSQTFVGLVTQFQDIDGKFASSIKGGGH